MSTLQPSEIIENPCATGTDAEIGGYGPTHLRGVLGKRLSGAAPERRRVCDCCELGEAVVLGRRARLRAVRSTASAAVGGPSPGGSCAGARRLPRLQGQPRSFQQLLLAESAPKHLDVPCPHTLHA